MMKKQIKVNVKDVEAVISDMKLFGWELHAKIKNGRGFCLILCRREGMDNYEMLDKLCDRYELCRKNCERLILKTDKSAKDILLYNSNQKEIANILTTACKL